MHFKIGFLWLLLKDLYQEDEIKEEELLQNYSRKVILN